MRQGVLLLLLLAATVSACATMRTYYPLPTSAIITVGEREIDSHTTVTGDDYFCKNWSVTPREIRQYFHTYHLLMDREYHDMYLYLPCHIEGTVSVRGKTYHWVINPGNVMVTDWPDGQFKTMGGKYTDDPSGGLH